MLLIAGASGFLGANALLEAIDAGREVAGAFHSTPVHWKGIDTFEADLDTPEATSGLLDSVRPDWVLNCAALADVDGCERDPAAARRINTDMARTLAASCRAAGARLLHISTDSVFDGKRGNYSEKDEPSPINVYARTKLDGERAVAEEFPDALIVRTNFFGISPGERTGLADWVIKELTAGNRVPGFTDVVFAPLLANDLARVLFAMMDSGLSGLYHLGSSTRVSKFDFVALLARSLGLDEKLVQPARISDGALRAARPRDTSLCSARAESALGQRMASVESSIGLFEQLRRAGHAGRLNALFGS
jgi:dTDP-4-dehydrorhamnose reductase